MDSEDLVEEICCMSFFADFTVRSPKYLKACGLEREVADLLVPVRDTLYVFQVKSMLHRAAVSDAIREQRAQARIDKAIKQFHSLGEAIRSRPKTRVVSSRGIEFEIDFKAMKHIYLLVVFDLRSEADGSSIANIRIGGSCFHGYPIPLHILTRREFEAIATECDTIPDFSAYLDFREFLHHAGYVHEDADPLDVLALFQFRRAKALEVLEKRQLLPFRIDGLWLKCITRHKDAIIARYLSLEPSYLIDLVIEQLHTSIGYHPPVTEKVRKRLGLPTGSVGTYRQIIETLTLLNREDRCVAGQMLQRKMEIAAHAVGSFGGIVLPNQSLGVVFLASQHDRAERSELLAGVSIAFMGTAAVDTVIGIAVGSTGSSKDGLDALLIRSRDTQIPPHVLAKAKSLFSAPAHAKGVL